MITLEEINKKRGEIIKFVQNILDEEVQKGTIENWGHAKYDAWLGVPYIEIKGQRLFLCTTYLYRGAYGITTIYDYETKRIIKEKIKYILDNQEILDAYCIDCMGTFKEVNEERINK